MRSTLERVQLAGVNLLWELGDLRARMHPASPLAEAIDLFRVALDEVECALDPTLAIKGE